MKYPSKILRPEVDSYYVASVNERYQRMNDSYNDGDYGETINYARSMVESVCKYVYRQVKNSRMEDDIKDDRLPKVVNTSLAVLKSEMSLPNEFKRLANDMSNTMVSLGKIRNKTSVSHGSDTRTIDISAPEAKYAAFMAESFTNFVLELLFNKTHSMKNNAIGSVVDTTHLRKISEIKDMITYKDDLSDVTYLVTPGNNTIFQVKIDFPEIVDFKMDTEFFSEHIKGYVEDDAIIEDGKQTGIDEYKYYSPRKDFYYLVSINKETNVMYISRDFLNN